jgi:hypothetical protein
MVQIGTAAKDRRLLRTGISGRHARSSGLAAVTLAGTLAFPAFAQADTPPSIQGPEPPREGQTLHASDGSYPISTPGFSRVVTARRWLRCNPSLSGCVQTGAGKSYLVTQADVGRRLVYQVTVQCQPAPAQNVCADRTAQASTATVLDDPQLQRPPTISGVARRGEILFASPGSWGTWSPPLSFSYAWQRCDAGGAACTTVAGGQGYTLGAADVGHAMRVVVTANAGGRATSAASAATRRVERESVTNIKPHSRSTRRLLSPFPRVLISGRTTRRGARITSFVVRGPRGARVSLRCRGSRCPFSRRSFRLRSSRKRIRSLQRVLLAGTVIEVRVAKGRKYGKFTRIRIRRGHVPSRKDRCLAPGSSRPTRCPRR